MPDPTLMTDALGAGWLTKVAITVFGGGGILATFAAGRENGKAAYLNSVAAAADLVIKNRGDEITRLNGVVETLRTDIDRCEDRHDECEDRVNELDALIRTMGPIPAYTDADIEAGRKTVDGAIARRRGKP